MDPLYALEKFNDITHTLGTGSGSIKERLKDSMRDFAPLTSKDMPNKVVAEFNSIRQRLTSQKAVGAEGNFAASIDAMSEEDAVKLAKDIFELTAKLS